MTDRSIFAAALDIPDPAERAAYLDRACGGDANLRAHIDGLLAAEGDLGSFLNRPAAVSLPTVTYEPITEGPGAVIGRYKLLQQIGEGGFGSVYMAEQREPVKRRVALKIIKLGMDTREVVARFEAERQALALMDHPNIARVLDAGATDTGRPYFVMELVKGVPITAFCDENHLPARDRLGLFAQVCQAVQHAHQKGVIHRDIKPSNVLVTLHDGKPVPKVIDFGVAKALNQELTERTLFTAYGHMIGTPQYMSPEQAEMSGLDIDTRSDVYSLGVLLFELLTGTTPIEAASLRKAGYAEMQRLIKEHEAPRPSQRVSTLGERLSVVARDRGCDPSRLGTLLRGELDWIVLKALEKERGRRYESASGFAADVQRFLASEPVEAHPPSAGYRVRKFVRRNRGPVAAAAAVVAVLCLGLAGTAAGMVLARTEADRAARAEAATAEQRDAALQAAEEKEKARQAEAEHRANAERREREATAARADLRRSHYAATMNLIPAAWKADNVKRVIELLNEVKPKDGEADLRNFEWHYWDRQCHAERRALPLPKDVLGPGCQFSDDGTRTVYPIRAEPLPPGEQPGGGRPFPALKRVVIDSATGRTLFTSPAMKTSGFTSHGLSPDGKRLVTVSLPTQPNEPPKLAVWDVDTGKSNFDQSIRGFDTSDKFTFSPDGTLLAIPEAIGDPEARVRRSTHIRLWHLADSKREPLVVGKADVDRQLTVSFRPDGHRIAVLNSYRTFRGTLGTNVTSTIELVDAATGVPAGKIEVPGMVRQVAFTPDGKQLVGVGNIMSSARSDGFRSTYVWDVTGAEPKEVRKTPLPSSLGTNLVSSFTLSSDGRRMAVWAGTDEPLHVIDVASGELRQTIKPIERLFAAAFTANGSRVLTVSGLGEGIRGGGGSGAVLHEWDLTPDPTPPIKATSGPKAVWSKNGQRQVEYGQAEKDRATWITVRDKTSKELAVFKEHTSPPSTVDISPNGRMVVSGRTGRDGKYYVWEADTGKVRFTDTIELLLRVSISSDGRLLYLPGKEGGSVVRFDDLHELFRVPKDIVAHFSPDSRRLVTISGIRRGSFTPRPMNPNDRPEPEPEPTEKPELTLWNLETGQKIRSEALPQSPAPFGIGTRVFFSDDGKFFLATNAMGRERTEGSTIAVYDATTGEPKGPRIPVGSVSFSPTYAFSPDGSKLVMHSNSSTPWSRIEGAQVYDVASGKPAFRLEGQVGVVAGLTFSPDGTRIATVAAEGSRSELTLRLWDAATGRGLLSVENVAARLRQLPGRGFASINTKLSFSPDGRTLTLRQPNDGGREVIETWDATPRPEPKK